MKALRKSSLIAVVAIVMVAVSALPAFAGGGSGTFVAEATWTTYTIDSRVGGGYWADIVLNSHALIYEIGEGEYKLVVSQTGSFTSGAGISPNATGTIEDGVTGSISGGFVGYINGELRSDLGNEGTFDYECDREAGLCPNFTSFRDILFEEHSGFRYDTWEWMYSTCDARQAIQSSSKGNVGDITGGPAVCETDTPEPLVNMTVFYSESGFYEHEGGTVNTCSIFMAPGLDADQPATDSIDRWCTQVPEDVTIGCQADLYDNGAEGTFACDGFLGAVGERRASLRDDIQGEEFDLLPKIQRYLSQIRELGLIE